MNPHRLTWAEFEASVNDQLRSLAPYRHEPAYDLHGEQDPLTRKPFWAVMMTALAANFPTKGRN